MREKIVEIKERVEVQLRNKSLILVYGIKNL